MLRVTSSTTTTWLIAFVMTVICKKRASIFHHDGKSNSFLAFATSYWQFLSESRVIISYTVHNCIFWFVCILLKINLISEVMTHYGKQISMNYYSNNVKKRKKKNAQSRQIAITVQLRDPGKSHLLPLAQWRKKNTASRSASEPRVWHPWLCIDWLWVMIQFDSHIMWINVKANQVSKSKTCLAIATYWGGGWSSLVFPQPTLTLDLDPWPWPIISGQGGVPR